MKKKLISYLSIPIITAMLYLPAFARNKTIDHPNAIEVMQHEYAITQPTTQKPVMQTAWISACIAVTLYDKETKTGVITHTDVGTNIEGSFEEIFSKLEKLGVKTSNLESRIIGGATYKVCKENIKIIKGVLEKYHVKVVEEDTLGNIIRAIQIDTRTGEVMDYEETVSSTSKEKLAEKMKRLFKDKEDKLCTHESSL